MPDYGKVLAQDTLSAAAASDVYIAPTSRGALVCAEVCNQNGSAAKIRISVRKSNAAQTTDHYVVYDASLPANATFEWGGFPGCLKTISERDALTFYSDKANVSVTVYGIEEE